MDLSGRHSGGNWTEGKHTNFMRRVFQLRCKLLLSPRTVEFREINRDQVGVIEWIALVSFPSYTMGCYSLFSLVSGG